ncbi:Arm DNA-binding domain-containing protein [Salinimicrobium sp. TIG7-5_MAKvit]|uniref:Arm DNA-binding domain-containing protein n=1 Tax=Salinimicrobium sp. TIG7-5_MAKvit TaxID=3121289 RepID=UPI003C6E673A
MDSSFFHIFYLRGSNKESTASIYLRVTINGKRAAMSLNRKILVQSWNSSAGRANGNSSEAKLLNRYLSKVENDLFKTHQNLLEKMRIFRQMI